MEPSKHRVVVLGGGFGGLQTARRLSGANVEVTLIDRENHHLFQPLLYQVATASLAPGSIALPIRGVLSGQKNLRVMLGEAAELDREKQAVVLTDGERVPYDSLVISVGCRTNYFGHEEEWAPTRQASRPSATPSKFGNVFSSPSKPRSEVKTPKSAHALRPSS